MSLLSDVAPFAKAKVMLEQYPTSAHIASHIFFAAHEQIQDIANGTVVDLGTGTGMLATGASLMGAAHVVGVDIDDAAFPSPPRLLGSSVLSHRDLHTKRRCRLRRERRVRYVCAKTYALHVAYALVLGGRVGRRSSS